MARGATKWAKQLPGVARVCTVATPLARPLNGLVAVTSSPAVGCVLAVATLRADNFCEGELTLMAMAEKGLPMIVGRQTFLFDSGHMCGIAKLVWAGVSVVGVMSLSGELLFVRSGLRESGGLAGGNTSDEESCGSSFGSIESADDRPFLRAEARAVDICAMTVGGCPLVVAAGHRNTFFYVFPRSHCCGGMSYERREMNIGPFNAVACAADCSSGSALLLGCMLVSIVVFDCGASPFATPVVLRTILIGPSTRYIGMSEGTLFFNESERSLAFCAFGMTIEEKNDTFSLRRTDGTLFDLENASENWGRSLSSWNTVFCDAPGRLCVEGPSLMVLTQPLCCNSTSIVHHALVITITQRRTCGKKDFVEKLDETNEMLPSLSLDIKVMEATSPNCLRALSMFALNVSLSSFLRFTKKPDNSQIMELCLCDGKNAVFFDITDKTRLEPSGVISSPSDDSHLVGLAWLTIARDVLVLSGDILDEVEKVDKREENTNRSTAFVSNLGLFLQEPSLWEENDVLIPLTLTQVREVVQSVVREESKKIICFLDTRLSALESAMSNLMLEGANKDSKFCTCMEEQ